jgi:N-acyl-L-homoserine lactone synthetase
MVASERLFFYRIDRPPGLLGYLIVNRIPIFPIYSHHVINSLLHVFMKLDLKVIQERFTVDIANTPELIQSAHRLRYQVYCAENSDRDEDGFEVDEFDCHSRHVILTAKYTGEVVGTVRLVFWPQGSAEPIFPIQQVTTASLNKYVTLITGGEISHFAISKPKRQLPYGEAWLLLMLMKGVVRLSDELGITDWVSVMEPRLLQLLRTSAIYFNPIGDPIGLRGIQQPCYTKINAMLARVRYDRPEIWDLLTDGGTLWPESADLAEPSLTSRKPLHSTYKMGFGSPRLGSLTLCPRSGDMDRNHSVAVQGTNNARFLVPG